MGGRSSKEHVLGVPKNPRVQYVEENKNKTGIVSMRDYDYNYVFSIV